MHMPEYCYVHLPARKSFTESLIAVTNARLFLKLCASHASEAESEFDDHNEVRDQDYVSYDHVEMAKKSSGSSGSGGWSDAAVDSLAMKRDTFEQP